MKHIDLEKLKAAEITVDPFEYTTVSGFLNSDSLSAVIDEYPNIMKGGSFPLDTVDVSNVLQEVIDELNSPEFEAAVEDKFNVDLKGRPKMYSLRGYCRKTDGKIHTDSKDKIITVLLYLNQDWDEEGGKLRLLRDGNDLNDYADEVAPDNGTLLIFKRSDKSFHGHGPFEGVRRSIQMNWMTSENRRVFHKIRHTVSAGIKKIAASMA